MLIVGAGMAGLLAGRMLRRYSPRIIEAQPKLPNNHAALLRFRSNVVSEVTGIPFKKVEVRKAIWRDNKLRNYATLADSNEYSIKVTGEVMDRSILSLEPVTRWIAPEDFITQLARDLDVQYDTPLDKETIEYNHAQDDNPIVSTIPMPALMKMVGWEAKGDPFSWRPIWTISTRIRTPKVRVYQTIYYPEHRPGLPMYRASITGDILSIEYASEPHPYGADSDVSAVLEHFLGHTTKGWNAPTIKKQEYGKLIPADEQARRAFVMAMTDRYNLWSLGRFATWRQLLLDDVVDDVRFIDSILTTRDQYSRRMHYASDSYYWTTPTL